jgi:polyhydroxyalkanoate synthase
MPAAMHSFYLRKFYRDNLLAKKNGVTINEVPIDIRKIKTPCYFLSTKEDHIAPWKATYSGAFMTSGDSKFTLAASGHVAGVINPPEKDKYCYWTSDKMEKDPEDWLKNATETKGSWWPHWHKWLKEHSGTKVHGGRIGING